MSHYHHSHTKLFNDFQLIHTHQDLLQIHTYQDLFPAVIVPLKAIITSLLPNIVPNKLLPNVAANIPKHPLFCSFTSFSTVSLGTVH